MGIGFGVAQLVHSALERSALEPLHLTLYSAPGPFAAGGDLHLTPQELFDYLKQQSENAKARVFAAQNPVLVEPQP